jgi:hypothetical protein
MTTSSSQGRSLSVPHDSSDAIDVFYIPRKHSVDHDGFVRYPYPADLPHEAIVHVELEDVGMYVYVHRTLVKP